MDTKRTILIFFVCSFIFCSSFGAVSASAIDWNAGYVEAEGYGMAPANAANMAQNRGLARRAAIADAYRNLAEEIRGVHVDAQTTVKDLAVQSDIVNTSVSAFIKHAQIISEQQLPDGTYRVMMRVSLYGNNGLEAVFPQINPMQSQTLQQLNRQENLNKFPVVQSQVVPIITSNNPLQVLPNVQSQFTANRRSIQEFHWQSKDDHYDYFTLTLFCPQPTDIQEIYFDDYTNNHSVYYSMFYQDAEISKRDGSLGVFNGTATIKIKTSHKSDWKPGDKFYIEVLFADGSRLHQELTYYSTVSAAPVSYLFDDLVFVDRTQDKAGQGLKGMPNGHPDWHVKLRLNLPANTDVSRIVLREADKNGEIYRYGSIWDTKNVKNDVLVVCYQGQQLNYNHVSTVGTFSGITELDLYANQNREQKYLVAFVYFKDGSANARLVKTKDY